MLPRKQAHLKRWNITPYNSRRENLALLTVPIQDMIAKARVSYHVRKTQSIGHRFKSVSCTACFIIVVSICVFYLFLYKTHVFHVPCSTISVAPLHRLIYHWWCSPLYNPIYTLKHSIEIIHIIAPRKTIFVQLVIQKIAHKTHHEIG